MQADHALTGVPGPPSPALRFEHPHLHSHFAISLPPLAIADSPKGVSTRSHRAIIRAGYALISPSLSICRRHISHLALVSVWMPFGNFTFHRLSSFQMSPSLTVTCSRSWVLGSILQIVPISFLLCLAGLATGLAGYGPEGLAHRELRTPDQIFLYCTGQDDGDLVVFTRWSPPVTIKPAARNLSKSS